MKEKYFQIREIGGYSIVNNISFIKIKGSDSEKYINSQTTNKLDGIENLKGLYSALTDRKAHIKSIFSIHKIDDTFFVLSEKKQSESLIEHLENFNFSDDFEIQDLTNEYSFLLIQGFSSEKIIKDFFNLEKISFLENEVAYYDKEYNNIIIGKDDISTDGFLIISKNKGNLTKLVDICNENEFLNIDNEFFDIFRIEKGTPKYEIDFDENNLLPETGFEKTHVSYDKGCYLGQEVIARIKTYGTIPKALIGLIFEDNVPPYNSEIIINGKNQGTIKSSCYSYFFDKNIALAYLHKDFRIPDEKLVFESNGIIYNTKVSLLPFYKKISKDEKAKFFYDQALNVFAENKENEAIELLNKAIELKNDFSDAYESLGVILSRVEKYDEAIEVMTKLTEISPNEPMARTNLSVFYMKKGDKDEAERQMGLATILKFKKSASDIKQKKVEEELKKQQIEAIYERMEMFKEVLETEDAEDLIANYGMGKGLFDLEKYEESIPYLKKAIEIKKDYSTAYLYLGKSLEFNNKKEEALDIYKIGINEASKKGDLMPLKEMEKRKSNLLN